MNSELVIATDLTNKSDKAITIGLKVAKKLGYKPTLIYVDNLSHDLRAVINEDLELKVLPTSVSHSIKNQFNKQLQRLKINSDEVKTEILTGSISECFKDFFNKNQPHMVFAGEHQSELFVGGSIFKILKSSNAPVFLVRGELDENFSHVYCGVDFNEGFEKVVDLAEHFCLKFNSKLTLFHSIGPQVGFFALGPLDLYYAPSPTMAEEFEKTQMAIGKKLEELANNKTKRNCLQFDCTQK